jgi:hypothetical protein
VEAHEGRIDVDSLPGKGSTFSVHLAPFHHRPAQDAHRDLTAMRTSPGSSRT